MPLTRQRKLIHILILIAIIGYIARPLTADGIVFNPAEIAVTDTCRSTIDGLKNITKRPNDYFEVFTHLKIDPGYALDYVYSYDPGFEGEIGEPLVYARKSGSEPLKNESAFSNAYQYPSHLSWPLLQYAYRYIDKIQPDQSPESYFQFVALALLGSQFRLLGFGRRNDLKIICDLGDVKLIGKNLNPMTVHMPFLGPDWDAYHINFRPVVLMAEKTVTIRIVTFTEWGGFFEQIYTLDKQNPANVIDIQSRELARYYCLKSFF